MTNAKAHNEVLAMAAAKAIDGSIIVLDMPEELKYLSKVNDWRHTAVKKATGHRLVSLTLSHSTYEKKTGVTHHDSYGAKTVQMIRNEWTCPAITEFSKGFIFKRMIKDQPFLSERYVDVKRMVTKYKDKTCVWLRLPLLFENMAGGYFGWHHKLVLASVNGIDAVELFSGKELADAAKLVGFVTSRVCKLEDSPAAVQTVCRGYQG